MIVRKANKEFLESFPELSIRFFVKEKKEKCILIGNVDSKTREILSCTIEIGQFAVDILYDSLFDQVVGFLEVSDEIVSKIQLGEDVDKQWGYFVNFANVLYNDGAMRPYYYPVFAEVVNAYRRNMHDQQGNLLEEDHFVRIGRELQRVRQNASSVLDLLDGIEDSTEMMKAYKEGVFTEPVLLTNIQAEVMQTLNDAQEEQSILIMVQKPKSVQEMWGYLLTAYASTNVKFKRCENCKRFFATTGRGNPIFCDRIIEGKGRTCRQVMPKVKFYSKAETDPGFWLYNKAYKTMYSRVSTGSLSKEMFKIWSKKARAKRDECTIGQISPEDYSAWLCNNGLHIDYLKENG